VPGPAAGNENSWAWRRLAPRWLPRLLFISNRAPGVSRRERPRGYWAMDLIDPEHLVRLEGFWMPFPCCFGDRQI
jgi:hypothetical protein